MSLKMQCTDCKKSYKVEDSWAGKRVKCKSCGNIMVVPTPVVAVEAPSSVELEGLAAPVAVHRAASPVFVAPPPSYADVAPPPGPYVTIPGEDLIDQWVPWAAVGLLVLDLVIAGLIGISRAGATPSVSRLPSSSAGVVLAIALIIVIVVMVAMTAASGALMLLGVYISSQIMKFPNHRMLYWRCIAATCAFLAVNSVLAQIGLDISAARYFLAIVCGTGVLWLMLRLRGPQFALAGGLAMLLGIIVPGGILLALLAALKSAAPTNSARASGMPSTPTIISPSGVRSAAVVPQVDPREVLRQASEAHLKQINLALIRYAQDHQNAGPPGLLNLVAEGDLAGDDLAPPGGLTYHFVGYSPQAPPGAVVAYEQGNRSVLGGMHILRKDGSIQFYPWNSGDYLIASQAGAAPGVAANHPQPARVYTPPPTQVDATAVLQKLGTAYKSYFTSHSAYPMQSRDLIRAGLLTQDDIQMGQQQVLQPSFGIPKLQTLPADFIVAWVLDFKAGTYTILYGDWRIQTISMGEFQTALTKSQKAARSWR